MAKKKFLSLVMLVAMVAAALPALATDFSGRSTTVVEWYDNVDGDAAMPVYEYLQLNGRQLVDTDWSFYGYGRIADDLEGNVATGNRLYSAFLQNNNLIDGLSVKIGRQFISTTAGASIMDGLYTDYKWNDFKFSLFGGGDSAFYKGYDEQDLIGGWEVKWKACKNIDLGASYLARAKNGYLEDELVGFDFDANYLEYDLYGEVQYDVLTDKVSYGMVGTSGRPTDKLSYSVEYLYSLPVFGASSIYSVFAVDEYQEVSGELAYSIAPGLRTFANITNEIYADSTAMVYEAGVEKVRTKKFSGYVIGTLRVDEAEEDLKGVKVYGSYAVMSDITVGAGLHVDVMERTIDDKRDETTSSRTWVDAGYVFSDDISAKGKVERVESELWDHYYRGQVALTVKF